MTKLKLMSDSIVQEQRQAHTVLIRMDKLGDLVISLPADQHPALLGQNVIWAITEGLDFVVEQALPKRKFKTFSKRFSPLRIMAFKNWLKQVNPQHVVILHAPWWVSFASWLAGVPVRIGPLSQWHSYLFLNFGVRQRRSLSDRHESDYNFDLIESGFEMLGNRGGNLTEVKKKHLRLLAPNPTGTIQNLNLQGHRYVILHPGMGGSALNWPPEKYLELAHLISKKYKIVVTGTNADKKYLDPVAEELKSLSAVRWTVGELSSLDLLNVISEAKVMIAPSTGVIHLAASLGVPTVGIYSPRRAEHPRRWGPRGEKTYIFQPKTEVEDNLKPEIMATIDPSEVAQLVLSL